MTVTDAAADPVSGATVDVSMQEHAFNSGTAANGEKIADGERYRQVLAEKFGLQYCREPAPSIQVTQVRGESVRSPSAGRMAH